MKKILILLTVGLLLINNSYCQNYNTSIDTLQVHVYDNTYNTTDSTITLTTAVAGLYNYNDTAALYINRSIYLVQVIAEGIEPEITTITFKISPDIIKSGYRKKLYIAAYPNCYADDCDRTTIDRVIFLVFDD